MYEVIIFVVMNAIVVIFLYFLAKLFKKGDDDLYNLIFKVLVLSTFATVVFTFGNGFRRLLAFQEPTLMEEILFFSGIVVATLFFMLIQQNFKQSLLKLSLVLHSLILVGFAAYYFFRDLTGSLEETFLARIAVSVPVYLFSVIVYSVRTIKLKKY